MAAPIVGRNLSSAPELYIGHLVGCSSYGAFHPNADPNPIMHPLTVSSQALV